MNINRLSIIWIVILSQLASYAAAQQDHFRLTKEAADQLAPHERSPLWSLPHESRAADIIEFLDDKRIIVGEVNGGTLYKSPSYGPINLIDANTGKILWRVSRNKKADRTYKLLATEPHIVLAETGAGEGVIKALDRDKGTLLWRSKTGGDAVIQLDSNQDCMVVLSVIKDNATVESVDLKNGNSLWKREINSDQNTDFQTDSGSVYITGKNLLALDIRTGDEKWRFSSESLGDSLHMEISTFGMIVWSANGIALLGPGDGSMLWNYGVRTGGLKRVIYNDNRVFCITGSPDMLGTDKLQALSRRTGKVEWSVNTKGLVVSPLLAHDKLIIFTIEDALLGLDESTGKTLFRKAFSDLYAKANPVSARYSGVPDEFFVYKELLIIDREEMGLSAHQLPSGDQKWETPVLSGRSSVDERYKEVLLGLKLNLTDIPSSVKMINWTASAPNSQVCQAQRLHNEVMHTKERVLDDINATRFDREIALDAAQVSLGLEIVRMETQMSIDRTMAAAEAGLAIMSLAAAAKQLLDMVRTDLLFSNLLTRARMELRGAINARKSAFKGSAHWSFFSDSRGWGVRHIQLEDGTVDELRFEPADALRRLTGISTEVMALSYSGKKLVLIGLGMDSGLYRKTEVGGIRGPKASLLCFDPLSEKPVAVPGQERSEPTRQPASEAGQNTNLYPDIYPDLYYAIIIGDIDTVRYMLDHGADPNQVIDLGSFSPGTVITPLRAAAVGHPDIVGLLLERGAELKTAEEVPGMTALGLSDESMDAVFPQFKDERKEVRTILKAAAQGQKFAVSSATTDSNTLIFNDAVNHLYILRRILNDPELKNSWKKMPFIPELVLNNNWKLARNLLERGADVNAKSANGITALQAAVFRLDPALIQELLQFKADPNITNQLGLTPLTHLFGPYSLPYEEPYKDRIITIITMLLESGADPNSDLPRQPDGSIVSLLEAAEKKSAELATILRSYGAR